MLDHSYGYRYANDYGRRTGARGTRGLVGPVIVGVGALLAMLAVARSAAATLINVTTQAAQTEDGQCGLLEAIFASQYRQARDGCPAGTGVDTIQLGTGDYSVGNWPIEVWNNNLTIQGQGMFLTTIWSANTTGPSFPTGLQQDDCTGRVAATYISTSATVAFNDLTLQPVAGVDMMGICVASGSLTLNRVRITEFQSRGILALHAPGTGGVDVSLAVNDSFIVSNHAYNDGRGGAGIYYRSDWLGGSHGTFSVQSSTIWDNLSEGAGGGIAFDSTASMDGTITDSLITANAALYGGGGISVGWAGGQFDGEALTLIIRGSSISNNTAVTDGGGVWMGGNGSDTKSRTYSSSITGNFAIGRGGGFYSAGQPYFTNTTIGENIGVQGAGLFHDAAESYLDQCTIANNGDANTQAGGGVYAAGGAKVYSYNIFANNTAVQYPDIITFGPVSASYNLVRIPSGYDANPDANDILGEDPQLGPLQYLGGANVYPLLAGSAAQPPSPAIDRIPLSAALMGESALDQRGSPRPQDGSDGAGRNGYDIGAFEQGAP